MAWYYTENVIECNIISFIMSANDPSVSPFLCQGKNSIVNIFQYDGPLVGDKTRK